MKNYSVYVPEVHYAQIVVKASSHEEALKLVLNSEGEMEDLIFSHTLEPDDYEVVDENDEMKRVDNPSNT